MNLNKSLMRMYVVYCAANVELDATFLLSKGVYIKQMGTCGNY